MILTTLSLVMFGSVGAATGAVTIASTLLVLLLLLLFLAKIFIFVLSASAGVIRAVNPVLVGFAVVLTMTVLLRTCPFQSLITISASALVFHSTLVSVPVEMICISRGVIGVACLFNSFSRARYLRIKSLLIPIIDEYRLEILRRSLVAFFI